MTRFTFTLEANVAERKKRTVPDSRSSGRRKKEDLFSLILSGIGSSKKRRKNMKKLARSILILAREAINVLLLRLEEEHKETTVRKIEIT